MAEKTTKVYIVYYSTYGHIAELAKYEKEGVDSVPGCEGVLFQVKETLPQEVLDKMHVPPQSKDVPFASAAQLPEADGFLFGFPTRFGNMPAQFKTFWDSTGGIWQKNLLAGKPFGTFTSSNSVGGGQEITNFASLPNFIHHQMIYVPIGYGYGPELFAVDQARGGTPWGASTLGGADGSRRPSEIEINQAKYQGKYSAEIFKKIAGKA